MANEERNEMIEGLMDEVVGNDPTQVSKDEITRTIENILLSYHLNTDMDFVQRIAKMKFSNGETISMDDMPKELQDAAFLPVNTIADIALKQDMDLVISQIPEWFTAIQVTRDAICEADAVDGTLARDIIFDKSRISESEQATIMSKIEEVEDRLELHDIIKSHLVFNTLQYGEGSVYAIPYAKVFDDLYNHKIKNNRRGGTGNRNAVSGMFGTSQVLNGYGYGESAEISLRDTIIAESMRQKLDKSKNKVVSESEKNKTVTESAETNCVFTEAEIMEMRPDYHRKDINDPEKAKAQKTKDAAFDAYVNMVASNIRFVNSDIALPVIEESLHDLQCVYDMKYGKKSENGGVPESKFTVFFESIMEAENNTDDAVDQFDKKFAQVKGVYLRILPATKLIPIRVDRTIIGYYYISDGTRPEETGPRKNSGLTGYTLRTPSIGYDTFAPDKMFCEKLATKIINNFDLKFMRDNTSLHSQIVAILQSHKFNESLMRFIFIPAENVITAAINKDGSGKGHAMLEPGLITARMYMFLKLYSLLYQINNSSIRVYNLRSSGMDKNYKKFIQEIMRKFAARRVSANDIFNYRASMSKVTGYSELVMPMGAGNEAPIQIENIPGAEAPINNELLDNMRAEALNATPVPSILVSNGGVTEIEFAKETELSNTRFNSFIVSCKLDINRAVTVLYRKILRWETDIDPTILKNLKFKFQMPSMKHLNITNEKLNSLQAVMDLAVNVFLTKEERGENDDSDTVREFKKQIIGEYVPELDTERLGELANIARDKANVLTLARTDQSENLVDDATEEM